ncbi:hypothetical protein [Rhizobium sp. 11_C7_N12_5]|uniref:hypothetical protein n=1 Tax=Rhizobium sp. 11_C7_N12_5 TaxID=3240770 RepID=UPI003F1F398F
MPKRRWDQTRKWTNLHLPHQVVVRTENFTFRQAGPLNALADDVAADYRSYLARCCDESFQVFCFAEQAQARVFQARTRADAQARRSRILASALAIEGAFSI